MKERSSRKITPEQLAYLSDQGLVMEFRGRWNGQEVLPVSIIEYDNEGNISNRTTLEADVLIRNLSPHSSRYKERMGKVLIFWPRHPKFNLEQI